MKNGRPHTLEKSANSQVDGPEVGRPVGTGTVSRLEAVRPDRVEGSFLYGVLGPQVWVLTPDYHTKPSVLSPS